MRHNIAVTYNSFFIIPLILWFICGSILMIFFTPQQLFAIVNTHNNSIADIVMYYITWIGEGLTITALLLLLLLIRSFRNWWYVLSALLCVGLPAVISQIIKHSQNLPRPYNYFHKASWIHFSPRWGEVLMQNSFPSGHTTGAFAMFCFLSMLLGQKYRSLGTIFFLLALSVAYSRIYLAAHFFADVFAGSIIGSVTSIIMLTIMQYYKPAFFKNNSSTPV